MLYSDIENKVNLSTYYVFNLNSNYFDGFTFRHIKTISKFQKVKGGAFVMKILV